MPYDWTIDNEYMEKFIASLETFKVHATLTYTSKEIKDALNYAKPRKPAISLTKCMECVHCCKPGDGSYRCKYSTLKNAEPDINTCHYERRKH